MCPKTHVKWQTRAPECAAGQALYEIAKRLVGMAQEGSKRNFSSQTKLPEETLTEWLARSATNRAYYAAYHHVTHLLETCLGVSVKDLRHSSIPDKIESYRRELGKILKKAKKVDKDECKIIDKRYIPALKKLKSNYEEIMKLRVKSDYETEKNIIDSHIKLDIRSFSEQLIKRTDETIKIANRTFNDGRLKKYL